MPIHVRAATPGSIRCEHGHLAGKLQDKLKRLLLGAPASMQDRVHVTAQHPHNSRSRKNRVKPGAEQTKSPAVAIQSLAPRHGFAPVMPGEDYMIRAVVPIVPKRRPDSFRQIFRVLQSHKRNGQQMRHTGKARWRICRCGISVWHMYVWMWKEGPK